MYAVGRGLFRFARKQVVREELESGGSGPSGAPQEEISAVDHDSSSFHKLTQVGGYQLSASLAAVRDFPIADSRKLIA